MRIITNSIGHDAQWDEIIFEGASYFNGIFFPFTYSIIELENRSWSMFYFYTTMVPILINVSSEFKYEYFVGFLLEIILVMWRQYQLRIKTQSRAIKFQTYWRRKKTD